MVDKIGAIREDQSNDPTEVTTTALECEIDEVTKTLKSLTFVSPNGKKWKITVDNLGILTTVEVP